LTKSLKYRELADSDLKVIELDKDKKDIREIMPIKKGSSLLSSLGEHCLKFLSCRIIHRDSAVNDGTKLINQDAQEACFDLCVMKRDGITVLIELQHRRLFLRVISEFLAYSLSNCNKESLTAEPQRKSKYK